MAKSAVVKILAETKQYDRSIDNAAKKLQNFGKNGASSLTPMLGAWGKLVPAIGAAVGGMATFDKAIQSSESLIDAWGRTTSATKAVVDGFFASITTGSFKGFITGLKEVVQSARDAYDAVDALGTLSAFQDADITKIQTARLETQLKIKQGQKDGKSAAELQPLYDQLLGYDEQIKKMAEQKAAVATDAYTKSIDAALRKAGIDTSKYQYLVSKFTDSFDDGNGGGFNNINAAIAELENRATQGYQRNYIQGLTNKGVPSNAAVDSWARHNKSNQEELKALKAIRDNEAKITEAKQYQVVAEQAIQSSLQTQLQSTRLIKKETSGGDNGGGDKEKWNFSQALRPSLAVPAQDTSIEGKGIISFGDVKVGEVTQSILDQQTAWNDVQANMQIYYRQLQEQSEQTVNSISAIGSAFGSLGDAIGGTAGTIVENMGQTLQAIAALIPALQAVSMAEGTEKAMSTSSNWIEAIAAVASVVATIVATFASMPKFATGGIVGGSLTSGDKVLARVNSGEMILNQSQQANLLNMINNGAMGTNQGGEIKVRIENNQLVGTLSNAARRSAYTAQ